MILEGTNLPAPWFWTSGVLNCEKRNTLLLLEVTTLAATWFISPWKLIEKLFSLQDIFGQMLSEHCNCFSTCTHFLSTRNTNSDFLLSFWAYHEILTHQHFSSASSFSPLLFFLLVDLESLIRSQDSNEFCPFSWRENSCSLGAVYLQVGLVHKGCHSRSLQTGRPQQQTFVFSPFWRLEVQDQGVGRSAFSWDFSPGLADGHFLTVLTWPFACVNISRYLSF